MKKAKIKSCKCFARGAGIFFLFNFVFLISIHAEDFGDITASADSMYSGNTYHGYAEMRVTLENRSPERNHTVTLVYPNNAYSSFGNCITRLTRTVKLAPGARMVVPLLQPPLPAQGDGQIRVDIDGRNDRNFVRAPNANDHCNYYSRGGQMATVLVSRNLDYDSMNHLLNASRVGFTAEMATGAPDAGSGNRANCWMPDSRTYGRTNWLELDFAKPQAANKIQIYEGMYNISGELQIIGNSGAILETLPMSASRSTVLPRGANMLEFLPFVTNQPVKSLRLNFGKAAAYGIAIDAVQISGPTGNQYASAARASSDSSYSAGGSSDQVENLRAESPAAEWSDEWLAYTPFDAVALAESDLSAMTPGVSDALENYLQAGGIVLLFGQSDLPASWHPSQKIELRNGEQFNVGFGRCFIFPDQSSLDSKMRQTIRDAVRDASLYWQNLPNDDNAANAAFPVVANLKIPARGIVLIMLAFVIVIGPANIIYLNRRNRRTWMLWTIPAISFATTLFVFAYSLLREGVTPDTRIAGLTVLDQTTHRAATIGATAFYCPLTPSGGLQFDFETEATPLVSVGFDRSGNSREVDWTQTQNFRRGWISARVPAYFHLRKTETRRERLQVVAENGKLQIVNGLGAGIKSLCFADADGKIYSAADIRAGQQMTLNTSGSSSISTQLGALGLKQDFGYTLANTTSLLTPDVQKYLLPNTYVAVLDGNPFIENALGPAASAKRTRMNGIVFGILESPETK
jgi:hypothetical protein